MTSAGWLVLATSTTIALYAFFRAVHARHRLVLTLPVLASSIVLSLIVVFGKIDLRAYQEGARPLSWLLGPATVALAVPLYRNRALLRVHARTVLTSIAIGSLVAMTSVLAIGAWFGLARPMLLTLAPKSVTTPIAMQLSERLGGMPSLTAAIVVWTGVLGMAIGPAVLDVIGIRDRLARGVALGTAAHGIGTARALEEGALEGAASSVAMVIAGILTAFVAPVAVWFLG